MSLPPASFMSAGRGAMPMGPPGGMPPGGRGAGPAQGGSAPVSATYTATSWILPFNKKDRNMIEQRARHPHRRFPLHFHEDLETVTCHWVDKEVGTAQVVTSNLPLTLTSEQPVMYSLPKQLPPPAGEGTVDVRLLLVQQHPKPDSDPQRHLLRRLEVIGAQTTGTMRHLIAYGGRTRCGPDEQLTKELCRMAKEQSGIDLSSAKAWHKMVEFVYSNGTRTIFFMPDLTAADDAAKVCRDLCKAEERDVVEEVEEHDFVPAGDDGMSKCVVKGKTQVKKRVTKNVRMMQPVAFTLAAMRDIQEKLSHETNELCMAVDCLDEWMKRDMAAKIKATLVRKRVEALQKAETQKQLMGEREERKRKREKEQDRLKRARQDEEQRLRITWSKEDAGRTQDERMAAEPERQQSLTILFEQEQEQVKKLMDDELEANRKALEPKQEEGGPRLQRLVERNQEVFDLFKFFDRPRSMMTGSQLPRDMLVNMLLAVDTGLSISEAFDLVTLGGTLPRTLDKANYAMLSNEEKIVPVPEVDPQAQQAQMLQQQQMMQAMQMQQMMMAQMQQQRMQQMQAAAAGMMPQMMAGMMPGMPQGGAQPPAAG
eukprot:TRINITY_DN9045_c1_g1_i1.p2 TRINITY_DN9045_c1_g1~~TRINITY_DN9045_c1_g1_i1.p2  ORF type:complete len:596 (+),score=228.14 TRINITY_DN9045_c1_g1_i1:69-1856(+)